MAVAQRAREAGVNVAMPSNSFVLTPYNWYETLGLYDYFDAVILSEVEKVRKPSPITYQRTLDAFELTGSKRVFVDDHARTSHRRRPSGSAPATTRQTPRPPRLNSTRHSFTQPPDKLLLLHSSGHLLRPLCPQYPAHRPAGVPLHGNGAATPIVRTGPRVRREQGAHNDRCTSDATKVHFVELCRSE